VKKEEKENMVDFSKMEIDEVVDYLKTMKSSEEEKIQYFATQGLKYSLFKKITCGKAEIDRENNE